MKLTAEQIAVVGQQIGADPLEEDNPVMEQLVQIFGEHTFYISTEGLLVVEAMIDPEQDNAEDPSKGRFVRVATWADEQRSALQPIQPEPTSLVLDLSGDAAAGDNGSGGQPA